MGWNLNLTFHGIGFMAYQQKLNPDWQIGLSAAHKYAVVCISPLWCGLPMIDFLFSPGRLLFQVLSTSLRQDAGTESHLPLSKIILIHNLLQMSYWLSEASLTWSAWELFAYSCGFPTPGSKEARARSAAALRHHAEAPTACRFFLHVVFTRVVGVLHRVGGVVP